MSDIPDWLGDVRAWLRALNLSGSGWSIGQKVFFEVPDPGKVSGVPFLRVYASGGPVSGSAQDAPLFDSRLSIEVWGQGRNTWPKVRAAAAAVSGAIIDLAPGRLVPGAATYCGGGYVTASPDVPVPDTGDPRIVIDCVVSIRAAGPADP